MMAAMLTHTPNPLLESACKLSSRRSVWRKTVASIIWSLNPHAKQVITAFGHINPDAILHTGLFDVEQVSQAPGWVKELRGSVFPIISRRVS